MKWTNLVAGAVVLCGLSAVGIAGCGSDSSGGGDTFPGGFNKDGGGADGTGGGGGGTNDTICLLNNCDLDRDCTDCTGGRTTCSQKEHRCIACGASAGGKTCSGGQTCTQYGDCVGAGVTCPTDSNGIPTVACKTDVDCGACDPKHQVCANGACGGCTTTNTTNCQSTDICNASNACVPACPTSCVADQDCSACNTAGKAPATACNKHVCAQCSATKACPSGSACDLNHGTCTPSCGINGRPAVGDATCNSDTDCKSCETTTACQLPIGGGVGTCVLPATGCSQLGKGVAVLPAPFDQVTNTCSTDMDCASVTAQINVGGILRGITGINAIKDANIPYSMHACASVTIKNPLASGDGGAGLTCGICVPCKVDTDCTDIDISKVAGDMFGPIGSIAATLLLDKVFGPNDHKIHMYCDQIAGGYGACVPCANMLSTCGAGKSTTPTSGMCGHSACEKGTPLDPTCDTSAKDVCDHDAYCCTDTWDDLCVIEVDEYAKQQACTPVSCTYKDDGTYCTPASNGKNPGFGNSGFICKAHSVQGGTVNCNPSSQKCVGTDPANIKAFAKTTGGSTIVCQ